MARQSFVRLSPADLEAASPAVAALDKARDAGMSQRELIQKALEHYLSSGALDKALKEAKK